MLQLIPATVSHEHINFLCDCYRSKFIQGDFQPTKIVSHGIVTAGIKSQNETHKHKFIVVYNGLNVGYAYSHQSHTFNHNEIGVTIIPRMRRIGLGFLAHRALIVWTLENCKAQRLMAYVSVGNTAERIILEKFNFQLEGVLRRAGIIEQVFHDIAVYGVLRHELEVLP